MELLLILSAPLWPILFVALASRLNRLTDGGSNLAFWRRDPAPLAGYSLAEQPEITDLAEQAAERALRARLRDRHRRFHPAKH